MYVYLESQKLAKETKMTKNKSTGIVRKGKCNRRTEIRKLVFSYLLIEINFT